MDDLTTQFVSEKQPRKIYSVSQVNRIARETLENFSCWVHGEVAELEKIKTKFGSSFLKFKLKDETNQYTLPIIVWPHSIERLSFELKDGIGVVIFGNLTLYEKTGTYQFTGTVIELFGEGALAQKFEELKRKLRAEGLFDEKYKKPIPAYPTKVGVITSEDSAAWIDFKKHTVDRFPFFEIFLANVFVQGEQAIPDVIEALSQLNKLAVDVIVITRGGGSLEDLAAFNSEEVVRAIFTSKIPVICAVGHERDETIADWVSDMRASTPTAAARLICENFEEFLVKVDHLKTNFQSLAGKFYQAKLLDVSLLEKELDDAVKNFVNEKEKLLENTDSEFKRFFLDFFGKRNRMLDNFTTKLELLTPQRILDRGYAIAYSVNYRDSGTLKVPTLKVLKNVSGVKMKEEVKIRLAKGSFFGKVSQITKD